MDYLSGLGLCHHVIVQMKEDAGRDPYEDFFVPPRPSRLWHRVKRLGGLVKQQYRHARRVRRARRLPAC